MINKLKKYIKFTLCMSLILGLAGVSYAEISASDGSSFVTKSEFDSALADFSDRLITFESSVNSRIDSQVTSYLETNGIWSKTPIKFKDGSDTYSITSGIESQIANFDTDGTYLLYTTEWNWAKMEKAGLSSWSVKQEETGYRELHQHNGTKGPFNTYTWYLTFEIYSKDGTLLRRASNIVLRSGNPTYEYSAANNNYNQLFIGYAPATYPTFFFVDKDEYVKLLEYWDTVSGVSGAWSGSRSSDWEKGNVPKYTISDCGIY